MIAYVYDIDSRNVVAKIVGDDNDSIDAKYADVIGDQDDLALTYTPAFGVVDSGLIDNDDVTTYKA